MLVTERERLRERIESLVEQYGRDRSALIPILQEIQSREFTISEYAMQVVADLLDIHPVEVDSVASFYSFLGHEARGEFVFRLCRTISCDMAGKDAVARQLENDLGLSFGETSVDGKFTLEWANCLGLCDRGPALLVNDQAFTQVTPNTVHDIIDACKAKFGLHATEHEEMHI